MCSGQDCLEEISVMVIVLFLFRSQFSENHDHMSGGGHGFPKLLPISFFRRVSRIF